MFVLSQDRLNMDLDRDCLELMLNLLESDVSYQQALDVCGLSSAQLEKNKQKVRELCAEIQSQGHAMHLNLDNITVSNHFILASVLLSLPNISINSSYRIYFYDIAFRLDKDVCNLSFYKSMFSSLSSLTRQKTFFMLFSNESNFMEMSVFVNGITSWIVSKCSSLSLVSFAKRIEQKTKAPVTMINNTKMDKC